MGGQLGQVLVQSECQSVAKSADTGQSRAESNLGRPQVGVWWGELVDGAISIQRWVSRVKNPLDVILLGLGNFNIGYFVRQI